MNKKTLILSALVFISLISCETLEQNAVNKAQDCLDKSVGPQALDCKYIVNGLYSPESYAIRCSADFLAEGVTASQMARAFIGKNQTNTSGSPLLGMMGALTFRSMDLANNAYAECLQSQLSSFIMFASMARMSTKIASVAQLTSTITTEGNTKPSQTDMEAAILDMTSDTDKELLGQTALTLNNQYCTDPDKIQSDKICQTLNQALTDNTSDLDIGDAILQILQNNT
jgi:hypothetical protein